MKTKNYLIKTILVCGLSLSFFRGTSAILPEREMMLQAEKTIHASFTNSGLLSRSEKVEILFSTGESGQVNFVLVKTIDQILKKEIERQFYSMTFPNLKKDAVNSVVLSFKTK